ncbi:antibiotic biosynthesis monooxygenase family protein [Rhodococcus erythropolis]|uniref:putative quinol monooxygenase n=1 Tax=Rhodococcus erythropolis TaxID=1833 RepID=UPI00294A6A90|nr:antibiotic biosynthesis monooxygenase family protein [Rhodococcus erythropolis]MDV6212812.1 antibiotic biosynthesis monooxygenase family protein [Rhodococcus erythropolis]
MIVKIVSFQFNPESVNAAHDLLARDLKDTRNFPGCDGVEVLEDLVDPTILHLVERWTTTAASAAYSEFRAGPGAMTELVELFAGSPSVVQGTVVG